MKNVLIACEESQRTCIAFRELGFRAFSCDLQECSGNHPEWHIQGDVLSILNGFQMFQLQDGTIDYIYDKWDLIIAHPPCTNLAVSGMRWFKPEMKGKPGYKDPKLIDQGAEFFMKMINADCEHIAVENPICVMSSRYRKPDQIINPWQFGHPEQKKTCLWLKNLPLLRETDNVYDYMMTLPLKERTKVWQMGSGHAKERSKTYPGIAKAFASQWGAFITDHA